MSFADRHAWKFFFGLGLLYIAFGATDLGPAVTYVERLLAVALMVIGVLTAAVGGGALRGGERWAWMAMWVWPVYMLAGAVVLANEPTRGLGFAAFDGFMAGVTILVLLLSARRYLRLA